MGLAVLRRRNESKRPVSERITFEELLQRELGTFSGLGNESLLVCSVCLFACQLLGFGVEGLGFRV